MKLTLFQRFFCVLAVLSLSFGSAAAKQLNFGTIEDNQNLTFNYAFQDYQFRKQRLSFSLAKDSLKSSSAYLKPNGNYVINSYITKDIKSYLNGLGDDRITYRMEERGNGFNLQLKGRNVTQDEIDKIKAEIEKIKSKSTEKYLRDYYLMPHPTMSNTLMPDYKRLTQDNIKLVIPVSKQISTELAGSKQRDKINYALNFLQSIPYDSFESIEPPKGLGYVPPGSLFMLNKGDCESKTIAAAAIYKTLIPGTKMIAIVIQKHVLLGMDIPKEPGDETISFNNKEYVLSEPTGSNILSVGSIFPDSKSKIRSKNYVVIEL